MWHVTPQMIIKLRPIMQPGMMPPRKSLPTEMPVMLARTIMGMLGGMMMPSVPELAIRAAENSRS